MSQQQQDMSVMLVTANVGTLFEMADVLMETWLEEFVQAIVSRQPQFVALHCQELGGKKASVASMEQTSLFARRLLDRRELADYDRARFFLDQDFRRGDCFTVFGRLPIERNCAVHKALLRLKALGSLYFAHKSLETVKICNFESGDYVNVVGKEMTVFENGTGPGAGMTNKIRFPIDHHPLAKGNRKGFLQTQWNLNGRIIDLVNIHLFYDEDNLVAMETSPSQYTDARKWGLRYCIDTFRANSNPGEAFFVFGDFNFRLDVHQVVKKLTEHGIRQDVLLDSLSDRNQPSRARVCYVENDDLSKLILTVEKKTFDHHDKHDYVFQLDNGKWLRNFDNELLDFGSDVSEMEINFPPSYPYVEDIDKGRHFMKTRCPAWCDRIIMNAAGRQLVSNRTEAEYDLIGPAVCMGDHKPVFLFCRLRTLARPSFSVQHREASPVQNRDVPLKIRKESLTTVHHHNSNNHVPKTHPNDSPTRRKKGCFGCCVS